MGLIHSDGSTYMVKNSLIYAFYNESLDIINILKRVYRLLNIEFTETTKNKRCYVVRVGRRKYSDKLYKHIGVKS